MIAIILIEILKFGMVGALSYVSTMFFLCGIQLLTTPKDILEINIRH
jgi:hypothetical protein